MYILPSTPYRAWSDGDAGEDGGPGANERRTDLSVTRSRHRKQEEKWQRWRR